MFHLLPVSGSRFLWICCFPHGMVQKMSLRCSKICNPSTSYPSRSRVSVFDRFCDSIPIRRIERFAAPVQDRVATGAYAAIHVDTLAMMPYVSTGHGASGRARPSEPDSTSEFAGCETGRRPGRSTHLIRRFKRSLFDRWCWPMTHCVTGPRRKSAFGVGRPTRAACVGGSQRRGLSKIHPRRIRPCRRRSCSLWAWVSRHNIDAAVCLATGRCFRRFVGTFPKRSCEWWVAMRTRVCLVWPVRALW